MSFSLVAEEVEICFIHDMNAHLRAPKSTIKSTVTSGKCSTYCAKETIGNVHRMNDEILVIPTRLEQLHLS